MISAGNFNFFSWNSSERRAPLKISFWRGSITRHDTRKMEPVYWKIYRRNWRRERSPAELLDRDARDHSLARKTGTVMLRFVVHPLERPGAYPTKHNLTNICKIFSQIWPICTKSCLVNFTWILQNSWPKMLVKKLVLPKKTVKSM
jgi:hypothetical protein